MTTATQSSSHQPLNLWEWLILAFITLVTTIGFVWSYLDHAAFKQTMVVEDGFTEWATVVAFLIILLISVRRVWTLRASRRKTFLLVTGLLALMAFFAVGEEISWGQRFIGVESPEFFEKHNAQGETNLHNLVVYGVKINKLVFGKGIGISLLLYLLILVPLYRYRAGVRDFLDRFAIPVATNYQVVAYLVILVVLQVVMESSKKGEMLEFSLSWLFLLTIAYPSNRHIYSAGTVDTSASRLG